MGIITDAPPLSIMLAEPRGFCAGVERAVQIVEKALKKYGPPVYVRHEIVHNRYVIDNLKAKGVVFVKEIDDIPPGTVGIFSAHGVSEKVENDARARGLHIIDATCPLVTKVHKEAARNEENGRAIILIGHEGHPEVEGTSGRVKNGVHLVESAEQARTLEPGRPGDELAYVTQTTLSVDDTQDIVDILKERFPGISGPGLNDICYATRNRQHAVKHLAEHNDVILVLGAENSSNSNRLRDIAEEYGAKGHLIGRAADIDTAWFSGVSRAGITAGASAPEELVTETLDYLQQKFYVTLVATPEVIKENISFKLPVI